MCIFGLGICRVLLGFSLVDSFAHGLGKVDFNLGLAYRLSVGVIVNAIIVGCFLSTRSISETNLESINYNLL